MERKTFSIPRILNLPMPRWAEPGAPAPGRRRGGEAAFRAPRLR